MLYFVYTSFGGNTERFVEKVAENYMRRTTPNPRDPKNISKKISFIKLNGPGEKPHDNMPLYRKEHVDLPGLNMEDVVAFFVPTYGEFNHASHRTENYVPQQFLDFYSHHCLFHTDAEMVLFVGGNRTFGTDFAKALSEFPPIDQEGGSFELSGTPDEVDRTALYLDSLTRQPA